MTETQEQNNRGEMVPVPQKSATLPTFVGNDRIQGSLWTSFVPSTDAEKAKLLRTINSKNPALWDHTGQLIPVHHLIVRKGDKTETDTGEVYTADRLIVITPDGTAYETASEYAIEAMRNIVHLFGMPPYDPPLLIEAVKFPGKGKNRWMSILPSENPFNPTKAHGKKGG